MEFSIEFLKIGAGIYQLYEHANQLETYKNCFSVFLCDDPRNVYFIELGAIAYDSEN